MGEVDVGPCRSAGQGPRCSDVSQCTSCSLVSASCIACLRPGVFLEWTAPSAPTGGAMLVLSPEAGTLTVPSSRLSLPVETEICSPAWWHSAGSAHRLRDMGPIACSSISARRPNHQVVRIGTKHSEALADRVCPCRWPCHDSIISSLESRRRCPCRLARDVVSWHRLTETWQHLNVHGCSGFFLMPEPDPAPSTLWALSASSHDLRHDSSS